MNSQTDKDAEKLFESFDYNSIDVLERLLTDKEIDKFCDDIEQLYAKLSLPELQTKLAANLFAIIIKLNDRFQRIQALVDSLTRCRKCGYYPFIIESGGSSKCPKCGVEHLRP